MPRKSKAQKMEEEAQKYKKYLQERKYEMFQTIPGLVDAAFVETPKLHILLKTITEVDMEAHSVIKDSGLEFEVKILETKDSQGKPVVMTDSGLKNPPKIENQEEAKKKEEEDKAKGLNDFVAVGIDKMGRPIHHKVEGLKEPVDVKINPADMVFKPGEL